MEFKRELAQKLEKELRAGRSLLLFGPRQTGKTTLIREVCAHFSNRLEYSLELPSVRAQLENDPEMLCREVEAMGGNDRPLVFVDEIQKVPSLMDVFQYMLDRKKMVLIVTGSSARKMRQQHTNWLPGRIRVEHLYPLTWGEMGLITKEGAVPHLFQEYLLYGGLPGIVTQDVSHRVEDLRSYSLLYLEEEIRKEAVLKRLPPFSNFLRLAAFESGSSPNASKLASEVGVSHTTIHEYYQILEDSLIIYRLGAFGRSRSAILRKPKYYFFDLGVRNAASGIGHDKGLLTLQMGVLFEHFVILEILAHKGQTQLSYWRTKMGKDVDLIIEEGERITALEIKATAKPNDSDFSGLAAFQESEKCDRAFLVCQVKQAQKFKYGVALPWWQLASLL